MKYILLAFMALTPMAFDQKVSHDKKTGLVTVDGKVAFKMLKEDCGLAMIDCHFDVFDTSGKKVLVINVKSYTSPAAVGTGNPSGNVNYYEFVFLDSKQKAEMDFLSMNTEKVAKILVKNKLFVNGLLDAKAVDEFVLSKGTPHKDKVKQ